MKIQLDIPEDISKQIDSLKIHYNFQTKKEMILFILKDYLKHRKFLKTSQLHFRGTV